jgi:3-hydroxyisobutyrate dehydrogenase
MRVGFVGLGDQGEPMAHRLLDAGFPLAVYARRPDQARPLVGRGAVGVASLAELAERSDVVGVCVGDDAQVEQVCAAMLDHLRPGSVLVVHSTVAPRTCTRLGRTAAEHGVEVLDAPVSGGRARAFDGALTVMVGGPAEVFARVRPVLDAVGSPVLHLGPLGSGALLKLVNNCLFTAQLGILDDAVGLLQALGMDPRTSMTAIASSTGGSRAAEMFVAGGGEHVVPRHQDGWGRGLDLLRKDLGLLAENVDAAGVEVPEVLDRVVRHGLRAFRDAADAEA